MNTPHQQKRQSLQNVLRVRLAILAWACCCAVVPLWAADTTTNLFRMGFSSATFPGVNENDAIAALKVWAKVIARERHIPMDPQPQILKDLETINRAIRERQVDALALNSDECWKLRSELDGSVIIAGVNDGQITEQYILLVHSDSDIQQIRDLRGRNIIILKNSRMSLAWAWFDTMLAEQGFPEGNEFCQLSQIEKSTKVVIPVFFRQADACVVNLRGFQTMCELNPQIRLKLRIVATSPALVPGGFCFRRDYQNPFRETLIQELEKLVSTPAGAQVLTLFQSGTVKAQPLSCLDTAFALLKRHDELRSKTNSPDVAHL